MIKKIFHTADIHIRLFKRHEEYREQFNRFYEHVKSDIKRLGLKREECRIVIVGDVCHSKNQMTPELIEIVTWFLNKCTEIAITVLTLGNHDFLANNLDRMDALTPIVQTMNNSDLKFLKHTGCYEDDNVVWCVYGHMEGSKRPDIEEARKEYGDDKTYIGLYHDPLVGLKTNIGFEFEDGQDISIFEGTDMVCCGDIHLYQVMDYHGTPIVQPSSMIAQDFGESVNNHGYVVWDVKNREHEHVHLPTDYGFYTFKIDSVDVIELENERLQ